MKKKVMLAKQIGDYVKYVLDHGLRGDADQAAGVRYCGYKGTVLSGGGSGEKRDSG